MTRGRFNFFLCNPSHIHPLSVTRSADSIPMHICRPGELTGDVKQMNVSFGIVGDSHLMEPVDNGNRRPQKWIDLISNAPESFRAINLFQYIFGFRRLGMFAKAGSQIRYQTTMGPAQSGMS